MLKTIALPMVFLGFFGLFSLGCENGDNKNGAVCGNGVLENGELCDLDQFGDTTCGSLGFDAGQLTCSATCEPVTAACVDWVCGDSRVDPNEACDGTWGNISCGAAGYVFGAASCAADCTLDASGCSVAHGCGDGELGPAEQCDPAMADGGVPAGITCEAAGLLPGTVACDRNCRLDYAGCGRPDHCGNGVVDAGELCDGDDLDGRTCADRFYFGGGTLACQEDCTFDEAGCVESEEGTTRGWPCAERGLPCAPNDLSAGQYTGVVPRVCVHNTEFGWVQGIQACMPACGDHDDCPLGWVCKDDEGVGYCGLQTCDTPGEACTLASGLPGVCSPQRMGRSVCEVTGNRGYGQSCVSVVIPQERHFVPFYNFQYDTLELCASGECRADSYGDVGVCVEEACDAAGVLAGTAEDTCPPLTNCVNTSRVTLEYDEPWRTEDRGACVPMLDYVEDGVPGHLACHVLDGGLTRYDLPCPDQTACVAMTDDAPYRYPGSLFGRCAAVSATPLELGAECTEHAACGAAASCVMADPFATPFDLEDPQPYARACRRPCDAAVFADNPACAGLPEGTTWVCLSVTRFFSTDHELTVPDPSNPGDTVELDPSPLGFCVPASSGGKGRLP